MSDTEGELQGALEAPHVEESDPQGVETEALLPESPPPEASALLSAIFEAEHRRYGFRIGTLGFLVKDGVHSEVVIAATVCAIPHSPRGLLGVINLRSNLVPVFDLHNLCGLDRTVRAQPMVLVIDSGEKAVGMPIDALPVSLGKLTRISELPLLPDSLAGSVSGGYTSGDEVWLEFDHERFFSTLSQKNYFTPGHTPSPDAIAL